MFKKLELSKDIMKDKLKMNLIDNSFPFIKDECKKII